MKREPAAEMTGPGALWKDIASLIVEIGLNLKIKKEKGKKSGF